MNLKVLLLILFSLSDIREGLEDLYDDKPSDDLLDDIHFIKSLMYEVNEILGLNGLHRCN